MAAVFQRAIALYIGIGHLIKVSGVPFQPLEVTVSFVAGKGHWQHKGGVTKQIVPHVRLICNFITCPSKDFLNQLLVRLRTAQLADRNFFQIN